MRDLLHPANLWWLPLCATVLPYLHFEYEQRKSRKGGYHRLPGHIVAVQLVIGWAIAALGWVIYLAGALIWWLSA